MFIIYGVKRESVCLTIKRLPTRIQYSHHAMFRRHWLCSLDQCHTVVRLSPHLLLSDKVRLCCKFLYSGWQPFLRILQIDCVLDVFEYLDQSLMEVASQCRCI